MKNRNVAAAIVLLAIAVFVSQPSAPAPSDQYIIKGDEIFRFPASAPGRIEMLTEHPDGGYQWEISGRR